jgi:SAM-dependent methyltransferase
VSFYDNFSRRGNITRIGRAIVALQNRRFGELIAKLSPASDAGLAVLEIGPGKGFFAEECRRRGYAYVAIEANAKLCAELQGSGLCVHRATVPPIDVDSCFDVVFMNQVFEHMQSRAEVLALITACRDTLKPGGLLVISTPDIRYSRHDFFACDYTHNYPWSIMSLQQLYMDFDFEIAYAGVYSTVVRGWLMTRLVWMCTRLLYATGLIGLVFGWRAYKIRNLANASCVVAGYKRH